jgi:hypothetical protein
VSALAGPFASIAPEPTARPMQSAAGSRRWSWPRISREPARRSVKRRTARRRADSSLQAARGRAYDVSGAQTTSRDRTPSQTSTTWSCFGP